MHPLERIKVCFRSTDIVDVIFEVEITHPVHHRKDPALLLRVKCAPVVGTHSRWTSDD